MKAKMMCGKAQTVMNILAKIQTSDANDPLEVVKRSISESVGFNNDCHYSWEQADIGDKWDETTIREGKIACNAAFDMAESIANHIYRNLNGLD